MIKNAPFTSLKRCFNLCAGSKANIVHGSTADYEMVPYSMPTQANNHQTPVKSRTLKKHTAKLQLAERFEPKPVCNSTQLDEASANISMLPFLQTTPELRRRESKLSSTAIHQNTLLLLDEETQVSPSLSLIQELDANESLIDYEDEKVNAFNNELYCSPADIPQMDQFNWSSSGLKWNLSSEFQALSNASSIESIQFQTVNPSFFKDSQSDELHVCVIAYQAKCNSEVDIVFADRVQIIYEKEEQFLVQNLRNGQCGYVPKRCLTPLSAFLDDLKYFI
jgi:hypothetical protein